MKTPDVTERHPRYTVGGSLSSNLVYTIWAVFGGFILHFLLSNYLTVLLKPSYELPVETAADVIKRDITPFFIPGGDLLRQVFESSTNPDFKEMSQRLVIPKDWDEFEEMDRKVISTGLVAYIGTVPDEWYTPTEEYRNWYRSSESISGYTSYINHLSNKKWPLKKVYWNKHCKVLVSCSDRVAVKSCH